MDINLNENSSNPHICDGGYSSVNQIRGENYAEDLFDAVEIARDPQDVLTISRKSGSDLQYCNNIAGCAKFSGMARRMRIEVEGGLYHVITCGQAGHFSR